MRLALILLLPFRDVDGDLHEIGFLTINTIILALMIIKLLRIIFLGDRVDVPSTGVYVSSPKVPRAVSRTSTSSPTSTLLSRQDHRIMDGTSSPTNDITDDSSNGFRSRTEPLLRFRRSAVS